MANTQISITANGTKTLATAGKYCDRNIDVNVNVETAKPTKITNLYDPANVVLKTRSDCSGGTTSFPTDNQCNYVIIPFYHEAKTEVAIRMRGIGTVRDRMNFTVFGADGANVVSWGQVSSAFSLSYDEYGDAVLTMKSSGAYYTSEWHYLHLNFQYNGINSGASTALTGPIITINEPIGSIPYDNTFDVTGIDADDVSHNWTMWGWKND